MIVYLPNGDVAPIVGFLRRCTVTIKPEPDEAAAIVRMYKQVEHERDGKPFQMWLHNKEERHADDSVKSAGGNTGRVGCVGPAGGNGVRKSHPAKRGKRGR